MGKSEDKYRAMVDAIPTLAWCSLADGSAEFFNQRWHDYTGLSPQQAHVWGWRVTIHPEDLKKSLGKWRALLASGEPGELEARLRRHDGEYRWFLFRSEPLRDERGDVVRWYGTNTDIENLKRTEEKLRQDEHELRRITDAIAQTRVNCAAISPSLITSELFGHEKGAFTGALQKRIGRFEAADGGTIFRDEIGDLSIEVQIALLRVLQEREFERVGSSQPLPVDVRVLVATNRDLKSAVDAGTFRQDLFYRLNVFPIHLPSLRERVDDIPLLVEYFIDRYARKAGKNFSDISNKTFQLFQAYDWPGNIRELQNVIERAVILCDGETFSVDEAWLKPASSAVSNPVVPFVTTLVERERQMIETALAQCQGRVSGVNGAAKKLGIPRQTLDARIASLGIDKYRFKTG